MPDDPMTEPKHIHDVEGLNTRLQAITRRAHIDMRYLHDDRSRQHIVEATRTCTRILDIGAGRHDHAGSIEGTLVELKDGSIYQLMRTETGYLYEATSPDGGLTWEGFQKSGVRSVTCTT